MRSTTATEPVSAWSSRWAQWTTAAALRGACPARLGDKPDATRLYRENLALKVRLEALAADILLLRAYVFAEVKKLQEASLATPTTVRAASPCRTHFRS